LIHALLLLAARATTEISFQHQTCSLSIKGATDWTANVEAPWISFPQQKGSGNTELEFIVEENTTEATRNAEIIVGDQKLTVTQHPASWILTSSAQAAYASVAASQSAEPAETAAVLASGQMTYHVDPNFSLAIEKLGGRVNVVAKTSDGGTLIGGEFSNIGGQPRRCLAKVKADGTLDPAFNVLGGFSGAPNIDGYGARVMSLAVQADGRIVVGGYFTAFNGTARAGIARLNADGTLDTSFQPGTGFAGSDIVNLSGISGRTEVFALVLQSDGRILVGGDFKTFNGAARNHIARLNADGSLDTTFNPGTGFADWIVSGAIVVQNDNRIVVGGYFTNYNGVTRNYLARLNTDGSLDTTFDPGTEFIGRITSLALQPDGRILVAGGISSYGVANRSGIARLNTDASFDTTFTAAGGFTVSSVESTVLQPDGRIIICGDFSSIDGVSRKNIARLNTDGSIDTTFNLGTGFGTDSSYVSSVSSIALHTDGHIVAGGFFANYNGSPARCFARLTVSGALDMAFTDKLRIPANITSVVPISGAKWVVGGNFSFVNGIALSGIARLNDDGSLDGSFDPGTGFDQNAWGVSVTSVAVQADNRLIVCGSFGSFNGTIRNGLARLNTNGSLDQSFDPTFLGGGFSTVAVQPDGSILLGGSGITRITSGGNLDTTFKPGGPFADLSDGSGGTVFTTPHTSNVTAIILQPDRRIVVGQSFWNQSNSGSTTLRLNADGSVDTNFQQKTGLDSINSQTSTINLALQPDGHIVVAGSFSTLAGTACNGLARMNTDGSVDSLFNSSDSFNGTIAALTLQSDGRLLVGGNFTMFGSTACPSIAGLNVNGGLDTGFTVADPLINPVYLLSRGDDNRLLLAGPSVFRNGVLQAGYVLLRPDADPSFTTQPQSTSISIGGTVSLTATATGYPQISYKWYKDGNLLSNQTTNSLALTNATAATAGSYTVVATNTNGATTSTSAVVAVIDNQPPPPDHGGAGAFSPWALIALAAATLTRIYGQRR
jgi:uncharacterized delta-60 repeat protein